MSGAQHTPGPWHYVRKEGESAGVYGPPQGLSDGSLIAIAETPPLIEKNRAYAVQEANARLIAAAPDLLAACEAVADAFGKTTLTRSRDIAAIKCVRAAIAKALEAT